MIKTAPRQRRPDFSVHQMVSDRRVVAPIDTLRNRAKPPITDQLHAAGLRFAEEPSAPQAALLSDDYEMLADLIVDEWGVEALALRWRMRRVDMRSWIDGALTRLAAVYQSIDGPRQRRTDGKTKKRG